MDYYLQKLLALASLFGLQLGQHVESAHQVICIHLPATHNLSAPTGMCCCVYYAHRLVLCITAEGTAEGAAEGTPEGTAVGTGMARATLHTHL